MAASRQDIVRWLNDAPSDATHLIVMCDTYDWEDYPKYVKQGEDPRIIQAESNGVNMQKVMEVYKLSDDHEEQLNLHRCFRY
jgi:hypothetical protein